MVATNIAYLVVMRRVLALRLAELRRAYSVGVAAGITTGLALFGLHVSLSMGLGWPAPAVLAAQVALGALFLIVTITKARGGMVWREISGRLGEAGYRANNVGAVSWLIRRLDALR